MCIRVVERYAVCNCVYFVHGVDQCSAYGQRNHQVQDRVLLVGHTCPSHAGGSYYATSSSRMSSSSSPDYDSYYTSAVRGVIPEYHGRSSSGRSSGGRSDYYY